MSGARSRDPRGGTPLGTPLQQLPLEPLAEPGELGATGRDEVMAAGHLEERHGAAEAQRQAAGVGSGDGVVIKPLDDERGRPHAGAAR